MRRSVPIYYKYMKRDKPPEKLRSKFRRRCREGGIPFEDDVARYMGDEMEVEWGPNIDKKTGRIIKWTYVGEFWWARKIGSRYQFGRLYAVENIKGSTDRNYVGLWDERRHGHCPDPILVKSLLGRQGIITGWNKYEAFVKFDDDLSGKSVPMQFKSLEFIYDEDRKKFAGLIK